MQLRPYQNEAIDATFREFARGVKRTCVTMATGCGKTVYAAEVASRWQHGRVMFSAHRDELITQAWKTFCRVTGETPDIEQGSENYANESSIYGRSQYIISSIQSLHDKRLTPDRFNDIGLWVCDESHRASSKSKLWGRVHDILREKNPDLRILGITATSNRTDGAPLLFDTFAYEYNLRNAIDDGWLVKPASKIVVVNGLDFSKVKKGKHDFVQESLAEVLEQEGPLHEIAIATVAETEGLQTVVFAASVRQAKELSAIINRYRPGSSDWVCGDQNLCPKSTRREILRRFKDGDLQYVINCQILVEGWDEPGVQCLVMARPTRSVVTAAQMLGRGTRALEGVLDGLENSTAEDRKAAIAASAKPTIKILDFVDQSRHPVVMACDPSILGGQYNPEECKQAQKQIEENTAAGELSDIDLELAKARRLLEQQEEERRRAERERLVGSASYQLHDVDPLNPADAGPVRHVHRPTGKPVTEKQAAKLREYGINPHSVNRKQAQGICNQIRLGKIKKPRPSQAQESYGKPATERQKRVLAGFGFPTGVSEAEAARIITTEINARRDNGNVSPKYAEKSRQVPASQGGASDQQRLLLKRFGFGTNISYNEAATIIRDKINPQLASRIAERKEASKAS